MAYSYKKFEDKPLTVLIPLGTNIIGGNDALEFSSLLYDICKTDIKYVIIDLSDVEVMNSSGLGMLISGLSTLKKYNISLLLSNVPAKVMALFQMTHLDEILNICDDVQSALVACI